MTTNPHAPPPEGTLIRTAREAPPRMSIKQAARLAGVSDTRWRQIEQGYRMHRGRSEAEPPAPAPILARMARVAGVTPDDLRRAGRGDAAAELEVMRPNGGDGGTRPDIDTGELIGLVRELQARVSELEQERRKGQADGSGERRAL